MGAVLWTYSGQTADVMHERQVEVAVDMSVVQNECLKSWVVIAIIGVKIFS